MLTSSSRYVFSRSPREINRLGDRDNDIILVQVYSFRGVGTILVAAAEAARVKSLRLSLQLDVSSSFQRVAGNTIFAHLKLEHCSV